ncbi:polysialyltransferase family glycosyltransferase [Atopococcus tabaci]|uniref:polysialyltransferase family glycosyltransferase n=1 Tax=Atopococcus tabaci TaxID=269774 RepID=UPI0004280F80|nr:polysialyltransferase family glycosyltransferase [Atopococcus tabaci]
MILVVCGTPFQALNLLTLQKTVFKDETVDVVVIDHTPVNRSIYKKLKEMDLFNDVFFAETVQYSNGGKSNYGFVRDMVELKHFLNSDKMTSQVPFKTYDYDRVLVPSDDPPSHVFWYHIKKHNPNAELYLSEDGTKTYSFFDLTMSKFKSFYLKKLFKMGFFEEIKGAYLHSPEYFPYQDRGLDLVRIPPLDKTDPVVKEVMNSVFDYEPEKGTIDDNTRFIFFDQAFQFESELEEQARLYKLIEKHAAADELVTKLHPRNKRHVYSRTMYQSYPFELLQLNNNIEDKVLISGVSTACLTPKLVFNEEAHVILLYKLLRSPIFQQEQKAYFEFAEKVKNDYVNKDRFFIPETEEELVDIIKHLSLKPTPVVQESIQPEESLTGQSFSSMGVATEFGDEKK